MTLSDPKNCIAQLKANHRLLAAARTLNDSPRAIGGAGTPVVMSLSRDCGLGKHNKRV
jgi:hypothetical protein